MAALPNAVRAAAPAPVTYGAPAGLLPAGHVQGTPYDAVLPSGRTIAPAGRSTVVGMAAEGVALSPDGRFAIVSNAAAAGAQLHSALDPHVAGGSSLAVVDVETMTVVDQYTAPDESFFAGIAALRDPQDPARTLVLASGGAEPCGLRLHARHARVRSRPTARPSFASRRRAIRRSPTTAAAFPRRSR